MTMLMSSGVYRSPSFQERCRELALRRPASMIAPARSGGVRGLKRRTVSCGETLRAPSRIESMPNMRNVARRPAKRRERLANEAANTAAVQTKCTAVDASRKARAKSATKATKGADAGENHATPPTTSGSSSVVVAVSYTHLTLPTIYSV